MYSRTMLFAAICVAATYLALWSCAAGWLVGLKIGDENGVLGWMLGGLVMAAGVLFAWSV